MSIRDLLPIKKSEKGVVRRGDDRNLVSFQREMNRLFDDFFTSFDSMMPSRAWSGPLWERAEKALSEFTPKVDISQTGKEVRVAVELPGMDEKDVHVELEDDVLVVHGEKKEENDEKDGDWQRIERSYGSFRRVIPLPAVIEADKAKAKFKKGLLKITLPKKKEAPEKRKAIEITSG